MLFIDGEMKTHGHHRWDLTYREAVALQEQLRRRVRIRPLAMRRIRFVAGADVAFSKRLDRLITAIVVYAFPVLEVVETVFSETRISFPYVPGLLSFREIPGIIQGLQKLVTPVDVILCDGQGIAHPRGVGLASHLGLLVRTPTIGCAKSRLVGEHEPVGARRGDYTRIIYEAKQVGSVLRTREGVKPVFVSPGHLVDHPGSRRIVLACANRYRLPEPTRSADRLAAIEKRRLETRT